ncbi:hypothetical protein PpBr36_02135 [Pyricularia pennisetigena]|uniref:hypothetical protein n=1 Tax=Pyricularia pennisetigena TaxID=1578925 RepID=UPI00115030EB|nr:hypothetical protein PpBr36_02135 [Pyricularia pennisetigena]TLS29426.1 hypothetical protein PpBr36_02135 [Pyricularia pennisetigena]
MQFPKAILLAIASVACVHAAETHKVNVGESGLSFSPEEVKAAKGDTIEFHFFSSSHDAVMGLADKPCEPMGMMDGSFSSGVPEGDQVKQVFRVEVNSTEPALVFCSVGMHCANGMVMAINPNGEKTASKFKDAARGKSSKSPEGVYGGTWGNAA